MAALLLLVVSVGAGVWTAINFSVTLGIALTVALLTTLSWMVPDNRR